ncbi:MAG: ComF family protein [Bryobacteraceae bacterium]
MLPAAIERRLFECACRLLFHILPEECRLCGKPLYEITRAPVCQECLRLPAPLAAEYFCVRCRTPFLNSFPLDDEGVCALCRSGAQAFDAAYSFGAYDGALRDLIHLFKYARIRTLAKPLGDYLVSAFPLDQRFDVIVPMPLHWRRLWQRGFNQADLLARELARRRGLPVVKAVRRKRFTASQAGLPHAARRRNVSGAFAPAGKGVVQEKRILLVDDVLTTGATASACARTLKQAGARYVAVLALARADRRLNGAQYRPPLEAIGES